MFRFLVPRIIVVLVLVGILLVIPGLPTWAAVTIVLAAIAVDVGFRNQGPKSS